MKPKTKVLTAVLLCCVLVLAFIACAGCTGTDPIVGTWVKTYSDDSKIIYEFESPEVAYLTIVDKNGIVTTSDKADGMYTKVMKTGDNRYESGLIIFSVSEDGYTMTETFSDGDTVKFTKYSNYNVPTATPTTKATTKATVTPTTKATVAPTSTSSSSATLGEQNALKKAQSYLKSSAFSYLGLISQLEYNGYTNAEATYAANNCGADWNEQALKKAQSYLKSSAFSYLGLIDQLEYNKFTHAQAVYGASNCGADWNEQAAKKAQAYLRSSAFSKQGLIDQLEYNKFTHAQAVYGASAVGY